MSNDDYAKRQSQRDAEYEREYKAWIGALPADQRRELERQGLAKPDLARHGNGAADHDMADSPRASHTPDVAALVDHEDDEPSSPMHVSGMEDATRILRYLLADVMCEGNARLTLECLAIALGLSSYNGESMTSVGKRYGVTRAAVSKRCVDITKRLKLLPSRAMRTEVARKTYQKSQLKRYRKRKP